MLGVHHSGFYAWSKAPVSKRAAEDERQIALIRKAWEASGRLHGYRKLHAQLREEGETCCLNRVARLARMAGIKAQRGQSKRSDREE